SPRFGPANRPISISSIRWRSAGSTVSGATGYSVCARDAGSSCRTRRASAGGSAAPNSPGLKMAGPPIAKTKRRPRPTRRPGLSPGRRLAGLLLGGGHGRGEGGVLKTGAGDHPYNDLELYVFLRGNNFLNERRYHAAFDELGRQLSPVAGVEVEFKVLSLPKL